MPDLVERARLTDQKLISAARYPGADIPQIHILRSERKAAEAQLGEALWEMVDWIREGPKVGFSDVETMQAVTEYNTELANIIEERLEHANLEKPK